MFIPPHRVLVPEAMDDPGLDAVAHRQALRGLRRLNLVSRTVASVWDGLRPIVEQRRPDRVCVLDLATGGGDLAIGLARRAARARMPIEVIAADISPLAIAVTTERAQAAKLPVSAVQLDALGADWPPADVVVSSLFLHHLTTDGVTAVLRHAAATARHGVIMSDLRRTTAGLLFARVGTRLLSRSSIVHADGPQSVRAAFTVDEMMHLAHEAGLESCEITPAWSQRQRLVWMRP